VIAIGWSATEGYVKELFAERSASGLLSDQLTIVDLKPDQPGHIEVCASFGVEPKVASVPVKGSGPGTTDDLLLWVQTLRGCNAIRAACDGFPSLQGEIDRQALETPDFEEARFESASLVSAIDNWLPAWLRMCFFVRAQSHRFTAGHELEVLPTEQRDAHIPWAPLSDRRDDLISAASIINILAGRGAWDFEQFPGAFWNPSRQELVLPVPIWAMPDDVSAVHLKSLTNDWRDQSRIASIKLLPLDVPSQPLADSAVRLGRIQRWKEALAECFSHRFLGSASNFGDIELSIVLTG
jgi:hypothetical protein